MTANERYSGVDVVHGFFPEVSEYNSKHLLLRALASKAARQLKSFYGYS